MEIIRDRERLISSSSLCFPILNSHMNLVKKKKEEKKKLELIFHKAAISCLGKSFKLISPPVSGQFEQIY